MIEDALKKIEDTVRTAPTDDAETKQKLLEQLDELRAELQALERTDAEHAHKIAQLAGRAEARAGLAESVREFEATHPRLGSLVRAVCDSLAAMGI